MSLRTQPMFVLSCDLCGCEYTHPRYGTMLFHDPLEAANDARDNAGWLSHNGQDICQRCRCDELGEHGGQGWDRDQLDTMCLVRVCEFCGYGEFREQDTYDPRAWDPVRATLLVTITTAEQRAEAVVDLLWEASDPCAVVLTVRHPGYTNWITDRNALCTGRSAHGDNAHVLVRPLIHSQTVLVRGPGPLGHTHLELPEEELQRFLGETHRRVPELGAEPFVAAALEDALSQITRSRP